MNKTILSGRLTKDPELRYTPNGVPVATFTLAVNRRFKKDGQPEADFINCVVWQKAAESAANYIGKGCRVNVVGRWETRNYEGQDGKRVYVNECIVDEMDFLDFKKDENGQNSGQGGQTNQRQTNTGGQQQNGGGGQQRTNNNQFTRVDDDPFANDNKTIDISDDDLPF